MNTTDNPAIFFEKLDELIDAIKSLSRSPTSVVRRYKIETINPQGTRKGFIVEAYSDVEAGREALRRAFDSEAWVRTTSPAPDDECLVCANGESIDMTRICPTCGRTRGQQVEVMKTWRFR